MQRSTLYFWYQGRQDLLPTSFFLLPTSYFCSFPRHRYPLSGVNVLCLCEIKTSKLISDVLLSNASHPSLTCVVCVSFACASSWLCHLSILASSHSSEYWSIQCSHIPQKYTHTPHWEHFRLLACERQRRKASEWTDWQLYSTRVTAGTKPEHAASGHCCSRSERLFRRDERWH